MSASLHARWFDGRSSRAREVRISLQPGRRGPGLVLQDPATGATLLSLDPGQVGWPEAWSARRTPRRLAVDLRGHGSLEVDDAAAWHAALQQAGHAAPLSQRMQTRWTVFVAVFVVAAAALGAFYRWGTPWAATQLTRHVPLAWEVGLSERALRDLDRSWLKPSRLPPERQQQLRAQFQALAGRLGPDLQRYPGYTPALRLEFRRGMGVNAFALPGGTVVMTDEMVELAAREGLPDDALLGVLAHELGHVLHRHTTRMVVEQGVLNVGLGLALGDVSWLVSTGGSLLTGLAYRRSHETEADCFALQLMRRAGLPTAPTGRLLLAVEPLPPGEQPPESTWLDMLSTHPATPQRARDLERGEAPACPHAVAPDRAK